MPTVLPDLDLTLGQMLWAVRYGHEPDQHFRDEIRYLRLLDIPGASATQASGPGKRIRYGFADLVELGLAVTGLDLGFRPKDIAVVLVGQREGMHRLYANAWLDLPDAALVADWIKSRGRIKPLIADEIFVRLHDRRGEKWGQIDLIGAQEADDALPMLEPVERFGSVAPRRLIPLKRLMLQWVAWALEAPDIKPGRR
ncbi:hypothetical protein [Sphingobium sp. B12D2B]|uniref:hypothetical protein n=1 Tax=Sphingobium sp. B12D2B TaxID=2940577 RepID=UPI0022241945|nr:hypothetical protein [Sphingobium sp. B12D2B]MCW2349182.1 hypothetical protein [Sphingobium sp. B12D2B]